MDYKQALEYLDSLEKFGIRLGLFRIKYLLNSLGNPQNKFKSVHVAGTNGKGSVCRMLANVLKESGLRTGAYTSPHLYDFSERITIGNKKIPKQELARLVSSLSQAAKKAYDHPTHFEFTTAIAFQYFAEQSVDIAVIETGMGGRLDATNTITPEVSIITNVELEHTQILGKTIEKIAREKAGITKPKVPVVTACNGKALKAIQKICAKKKSPIYLIKDPEEVLSNYPGLKIPLLGAHQRTNAAIAIKAAELLGVPKEAITRGIAGTKHPGRLELMQKHPQVIIDGAHNPAGISALAKALKELSYKRLILVIAVSKDKDVKEMAALLPRADILIATQYSLPRSLKAEALASILKKAKPRELYATPNLKKAVLKAVSLAGKKDLVVVAGSLYTAGEARAIWKRTVEYE